MPESTSLVHDNTTNLPDYAAEEAARLAREFDNLQQEVEEAVAMAQAMPTFASVETQEDADATTVAITRLRDLDKRVEAMRESEKLPHMRREKAVDSFFFRMRERLFKRDKNGSPGIADMLQGKLHAYNMKRLAEEQARRDEEARIAREAEAKARREREEAERAEREAAAKAARARSEATRKAAEEAAKRAREESERRAAEESQLAANRREAEASANVKPADMVRERHSGALNTMQMVWEIAVEDSMQLDMAALWPFVDDKAKLKAAEQWAKVTNYKKPMPGLRIAQVPKTQVRR